MLKLSKKIEYALMAVRYIALKNHGSTITAKEIAEHYKIPYELLAKILQKLCKQEIIKSSQGIKGGYYLNRAAEKINLIEIISTIEPNYRLTDCMQENSGTENCNHFDCCEIRDPLKKIHKEIDNIFRKTSVKQIF